MLSVLFVNVSNESVNQRCEEIALKVVGFHLIHSTQMPWLTVDYKERKNSRNTFDFFFFH